MTVTFTLTTSSTAAGPLNISGTTSGGALNDVLIATGVSKAELVAGKEIGSISETITGGTIASTGTCTTTTPWYTTPVTPTPTPTATSGGGDRYNCLPNGGGCVPAVDGDYASLTDCNAACQQSPN